MQKKLTRLQAYSAILRFLDSYYWDGHQSENLSDFISYALFWPGGKPMDGAAWPDWLRSVKQTVLQDTTLRNTNRMTHQQATHAMLNYFKHYCSLYITIPEDMVAMLQLLQKLYEDGEQSVWWPLWQKAIEDTIKEQDPRYYIQFVS